MAANDAKNKVRVKNIKRLLFAKHSMMLALDGCQIALTRKLTSTERTIYSTAIAAIYVSPFTEANGLGALDKCFSKFPDQHLTDAHNSTLRCRHELFAHRDMTASGTDKDGLPVVLHRVWVNIDSSEEHTVDTPDIKWQDSVFEQMRQLCHFQSQRLDKEFKKSFAELNSRTRKIPGRYELGVDYP